MQLGMCCPVLICAHSDTHTQRHTDTHHDTQSAGQTATPRARYRQTHRHRRNKNIKVTIPRIKSSSCARPTAKTGIRQRPPRFTVSCTYATTHRHIQLEYHHKQNETNKKRKNVQVNRCSRVRRGSCTCTPYVDSTTSTCGGCAGASAAIMCRSSTREKSPVYRICAPAERLER